MGLASPSCLCRGPNNSGVGPVRANKPGSDFLSALCRVVHEARNYLRLVACSVAASSTEAQGVQEGLSKVRERQGRWGCSGARPPWCSGGSRGSPLPLGRAALGQVRALWCGVEVSDPQRFPEVGMEKEWKTLPSDPGLKVTARAEPPECWDIIPTLLAAWEAPGHS